MAWRFRAASVLRFALRVAMQCAVTAFVHATERARYLCFLRPVGASAVCNTFVCVQLFVVWCTAG